MAELFDTPKFEISLSALRIQVSEHSIGEEKIFRLIFGDKRLPLIITQTKSWEGIIWTSIPQGRQGEAEEFGAMIDDFLKQK